MSEYNITLSQAENAALAYVAESQNDWIQNAVHERCRIAIDEIVQITVARCLAASIQIPGSKDEMVELAYTHGWVKTAAEQKAEYEAELAARIAAEAAQAQGE